MKFRPALGSIRAVTQGVVLPGVLFSVVRLVPRLRLRGTAPQFRRISSRAKHRQVIFFCFQPLPDDGSISAPKHVAVKLIVLDSTSICFSVLLAFTLRCLLCRWQKTANSTATLRARAQCSVCVCPATKILRAKNARFVLVTHFACVSFPLTQTEFCHPFTFRR